MELAYKKTGNGSPLIILHGLYGSSDNWMSIAKAFESEYEVYLVDQRNHGESPHSNVHTYEEMARDLMVFMFHHSLGPASIIGHSMGGKTASFFAAMHPELVNKLVVVDIAIKAYDAEAVVSDKGLSHKNIIDAMLSIDPSKYENRTEISDKLLKNIPSKQVVQFLLKNLKRQGGSFQWQLNLPALRDNLPEIYKGLDEPLVKKPDMLEEMPVLFINGELSGYLKRDDLKEIQKIFPRAQMETIVGAGHWVHAEKTDLFLKSVKGFLSD
ncbi:MAG: alpha/beta fold hydrolase [Bacteroidota bacterium]